MGMLTKRRSRIPELWGRDPLALLRDELSGLRSQLAGDTENWFTGTIAPALDMSETDTAIDVRMDLPGLAAKDIDIQVAGNVLTISGERRDEKEEKDKTYHRIERSYGNFSRSVTLPCSVNENEVAAEYRDGVLSIKLPKSEDAKAHKIKVKC